MHRSGKNVGPCARWPVTPFARWPVGPLARAPACPACPERSRRERSRRKRATCGVVARKERSPKRVEGMAGEECHLPPWGGVIQSFVQLRGTSFLGSLSSFSFQLVANPSLHHAITPTGVIQHPVSSPPQADKHPASSIQKPESRNLITDSWWGGAFRTSLHRGSFL
ncbi:hypothetical protein D3OALGA1CA_2367 [Olavius algarvensis associated proteobacterium Delta 3]|nr:hypothetical protein D3OALGA1CA_2367 [Olavius algarvensis associated proteobacterium Delta 3]